MGGSTKGKHRFQSYKVSSYDEQEMRLYFCIWNSCFGAETLSHTFLGTGHQDKSHLYVFIGRSSPVTPRRRVRSCVLQGSTGPIRICDLCFVTNSGLPAASVTAATPGASSASQWVETKAVVVFLSRCHVHFPLTYKRGVELMGRLQHVVELAQVCLAAFRSQMSYM